MQNNQENIFLDLNNEFFASLINNDDLYMNAPCGYLSFLPNGTIIKMNYTLCDWLQYSEFEVLYKKKFIDLLSKGGAIYYEMFYMPLLKMQGFVNEINFDIKRADGSVFPALINSVVLKNELDEITAINVTIFNITDRKRYESQLLYAKKEADTEKKRFELLADSTPDIIFTASPEGIIEYVNKRFHAYFNIQSKEFDQKIIFEKIYSSDKTKVLKAWFKAVKEGGNFETEIRLKDPYDVYVWHLVRAVPYTDDNTNILKYFGSCTNIQEQRELLDKKDEFISLASHELKTPLSSLKGYINILQKSKPDPFHANIIERCYRAINNMQYLVGSLLDVTRIHSGQLILNISRSVIYDVVAESIELIKMNYNSHHVNLHFNVDKETEVFMDASRIQQVLINLLSNSIKYSPSATKVELTVDKMPDQQRLMISVKDYGMGIPSDQLEHIFDKYHRVTDSSNNNKIPGLGIGLYIIKEIVRLHKSSIQVKSEINKGSVFYFYLPVAENTAE